MNPRGLLKTAPVILVALVSFGVYFNALPNGFVYDDELQIVDNYLLRDAKYIPEIFSTSLWEHVGRGSSYYRPFLNLILMANYHVFGLAPWGYHFVNVLFHALAAIAVYFLAAELLKNNGRGGFFSPPLIAALLFAVHPIHTEAVAWASGLMDLSFALFYMLSFYFYLRSDMRFDAKYALSVFFFLLAALSKEPALTLPLLLLAYDLSFRKEGAGLSGYLKRYIPYGIAAGLYFILRVNALGGLAPVKSTVELSLYGYFLNILFLFSLYLKKLLLPVDLNFFYLFKPLHSFFSLRGALSSLAAAGFAGLIFFSFRRARPVFLALMFILIPLLPVLYIPALTQGLEQALTERYLYLPSFGFVLLIAYFASKFPERVAHGKALAISLALLFLIYSAGTIKRNFVWKDSLTLAGDTLLKSPDSAVAHQTLGYALLHEGQRDKGISHMRTAFRLKPDLVHKSIDLGIAYAQRGLLKKAILEFHVALMLDPDSVPAHYNLGLAYEKKGWTKEAVAEFETLLKLAPSFADAHSALGVLYAEKGMLGPAIEHFEDALKWNPNDAYTKLNLEHARKLKRAEPTP